MYSCVIAVPNRRKCKSTWQNCFYALQNFAADDALENCFVWSTLGKILIEHAELLMNSYVIALPNRRKCKKTWRNCFYALENFAADDAPENCVVRSTLGKILIEHAELLMYSCVIAVPNRRKCKRTWQNCFYALQNFAADDALENCIVWSTLWEILIEHAEVIRIF